MSVIDLTAAAGLDRTAEPLEASTPVGSPEWWRDRLRGQIARRAKVNEKIAAYVEGRHLMAFATEKYREAFGALLQPLRDDWMEVVVEAATERLVVEGFRMDPTDERGDDSAWEIWQHNGLDARSALAHDEAVTFGSAYAVVTPGEGRLGDELPRVLVLPGTRAAVEHDPSRPMHRLAGLQTWRDLDGVEHCVLWTPDARYEWSSAGLAPNWEPAGKPLANEIGQVPIVALANRPRLRAPEGRSDLAVVIPIQDALNKLLADLMVSSEFTAFRQRWASGVEIPTDPDTGKPIADQWVAGLSRVWTVEAADVRFGEFSAGDVANYTRPIELMVRHIGAKTRTPPHYLMGEIVNVSAEALKAAEAGLVGRVRAKMLTFGEAWEQTIRLAFAWLGDQRRAAATSCEVIWRDPETRTEGERVDAVTKLASVGVPTEALWARVPGVTPQMIERWRRMREQDAVVYGLTLGVTPNGAPVEAGGEGEPASG